MGKEAFESVLAGLEDALAYAQGDPRAASRTRWELLVSGTFPGLLVSGTFPHRLA